jgi:hypothetical protein
MSNFPTSIDVSPGFYGEKAALVATIRLEPRFAGLKCFHKALAEGEAQVRQYLQKAAEYLSNTYKVTFNKPLEDLDVVQGPYHIFLVASQPLRAGTNTDLLGDHLEEDGVYGEDFYYGRSGLLYEGDAK